jgi:hypothetical protein
MPQALNEWGLAFAFVIEQGWRIQVDDGDVSKVMGAIWASDDVKLCSAEGDWVASSGMRRVVLSF